MILREKAASIVVVGPKTPNVSNNIQKNLINECFFFLYFILYRCCYNTMLCLITSQT